EGHPLREADMLGALGNQRKRGGEEHAEGAAGPDQQRHVRKRTRAECKADREEGGGSQCRLNGKNKAAPIEEAAGDRRERRLEAGADEPDRADRSRPPTGVGQAEWRERREDAEEG